MKLFFAAILCAAAAALLAAAFVASSLQDTGQMKPERKADVNLTKANVGTALPPQVSPARP